MSYCCTVLDKPKESIKIPPRQRDEFDKPTFRMSTRIRIYAKTKTFDDLIISHTTIIPVLFLHTRATYSSSTAFIDRSFKVSFAIIIVGAV